MRRAVTAGERGRRVVDITIDRDRGRVSCLEVNRQGVVPVRLFGAIVRVMAYERRR